MASLVGSSHHHDKLECGQWSLMKKLRRGLPSPWCCTGEEHVAQLLRLYCHPPQNKNGTSQVEAQELSDGAWLRSDGGEKNR